MVEKPLSDGSVAYYWNPHLRDLKSGFTLKRETLGPDYALAVARANELNQHLDAWRVGRGETKDLDLQLCFGTLKWLIECYKRSPAWRKVSQRSRPEYLGSLGLNLLDARGVAKLYEPLQRGVRVKRRLRQANLCMGLMARAWDVVRRPDPATVPTENPFRGVELEHGKGTTRAAARAEAYALHQALIAADEPHLAAVPLICFEWHQRPENVLVGIDPTLRVSSTTRPARLSICRSRIATGRCFRN